MSKNGFHGSKCTVTWKEHLAEDKMRGEDAHLKILRERSCLGI